MPPLHLDPLQDRRRAANAKSIAHVPTSHSPTEQTLQRAQQETERLTTADVLALQRSVGNAAVARLLDTSRSGTQGQTSAASTPPATLQRKLQVGPVGDRYEQEADAVAQSVTQSITRSVTQPVKQSAQRSADPASHDQTPQDQISRVTKPRVTRAPAQIQRWGWWDRRKARQKNMSDSDVVSHTLGEGGSLNRVDKVRYKRNIGKSKVKSGFFKPNEILNKGFPTEQENTGMANRAVASSRLDKWLGLNILAEEVWANHNGEGGSVSAAVPGSPLIENQFNTPLGPNFDEDYADPATNKKINGAWYKLSSQRHKYFDFANPATQKGLSDLQLLDAITGQKDRHGGNIFIDEATGKVKGIDNDQAFSDGMPGTDVNELGGKYHGLPSFVDERTAKKILKKKAKNLPKVLKSKYGGGLSDAEIQAAQVRMRAVKQHLKALKKDKKLVKKWDDITYLNALSEDDRSDNWGNAMEPSYMKRSVMHYATATDREVPGDDAVLDVMNPLFQLDDDELSG